MLKRIKNLSLKIRLNKDEETDLTTHVHFKLINENRTKQTKLKNY